jgi:16S rRNA (cytosine967-C5)-methyltransferase
MPRLTAFQVLRSGHPAPMRLVDTFSADAGLDARDRGLVRALVGTEIRRRATLRAIVNRFTKTKPSADLGTLLRLGVAQLLFLDRIPPHAALSETVIIVRDICGVAKGRVANAVLREVQRSARLETSGDARHDLVGRPWTFRPVIFRDPQEHPFLWAEDALSMPSAVIKRWAARHGQEQAFTLADLALREPLLSLRVASGERDPLLDTFAKAGARAGDLPSNILLPASAGEAIFTSSAFAEGRIAVQGSAAIAAGELVQAQAGERILDLCAAPGGKSLLLAGTGAHVTACDKSPRRFAGMAREIERLQPAGSVSAVASNSTQGLDPMATFDGVLVDAPCSNTGVLAARPGARWRFGPKGLRDLAALGAGLLDDAAERVRPGGRLVHSTCSLEPEENAQQVRSFLERHPGWELEAEHERLPVSGPIMEGADAPAPGPTDGGYAARLRRPEA